MNEKDKSKSNQEFPKNRHLIARAPKQSLDDLEPGKLYKLTPELLNEIISSKDLKIIKLIPDEENFLPS